MVLVSFDTPLESRKGSIVISAVRRKAERVLLIIFPSIFIKISIHFAKAKPTLRGNMFFHCSDGTFFVVDLRKCLV